MAADTAPEQLGGLFNDAVIAVPRDRKAELAELLKATKAENAARARRVLKHEDLRERLRDLGFTNPTSWNGWIPPKFGQEHACPSCLSPMVKRPPCQGAEHRSRYNESIRRRALVDIAAEAYEREQAPE